MASRAPASWVTFLALALAMVGGIVFLVWRPAPLPAPAVAASAPVADGARPSSSREDTIDRLLRVAPELDHESAGLLLDAAPPGDPDVDALARASLLDATHGFDYLAPADLSALSSAFAKAYGHLAAEDRRLLEAYLQRVRAGDPSGAATEERARGLFADAVGALPPAERRQLQAVYGRAIAAKQRAARRAAEPAPILPPEPEPSMAPVATAAMAPPSRANPSGPPSPDAAEDEARKEREKRETAEMYRSRLYAAEGYVKQAEARLKEAEEHWHFVNSHTNQSFPLDEARRRLDSSRQELERARKQREDVEDAARREGIPPGWLR